MIMTQKTILFAGILASATLFACNNSSEEHNDNKDTTTKDTISTATVEAKMFSAESNGIKVYEVEDGKEYPNAKLEMQIPAEDEIMPVNKVPFVFQVEDYELATPTSDEAARHCAVSGKGQHIHLIVDNKPYEAHYKAELESELEDGNHVVLAFLSRSYHESIKNGEAFAIRNVVVKEANSEPADLTKPMLFYSRPKGTYTGKDTEKLLLDFYLVNADLSEEGYKVKATIDGNEFILPTWKPYMVEGLAMGEHTFRIVMIDADGNEIEGSDSGDRIITLAESAE